MHRKRTVEELNQRWKGVEGKGVLKQRTAELMETNNKLLREIKERKRVEQELQQRMHDLRERAKELDCLYSISKLAHKPDVSIEEVLQETVDLVPTAWQYPEIASARITLNGQRLETANFRETVWKQAADIRVHGNRIGILEVCYIEKEPERDEGPFLKEERSLIDAIGAQLGSIIEHKQADKALKEAKTLLEKTFASLGEAVFVVDRNTRTIIACNPVVERIFGYSQEEMMGRNTEFLHVNKEMYAEFGKNLFPALEANGIYNTEFRLRRKDGNTFFSDHTVTEMANGSGCRSALVSVVRDIDGHKQAQAALEKSGAELRRLSSQLLEVQEAERKRISWELHDSIGQVLASVGIGLGNAVSSIRASKASPGVESLEALISMVKEASEDVRRLHTDLRPPLLDDLGIITTIFWFCREFEKVHSGIRIKKQINIEEKQVPEPLKIVIFRVLQEALNNVSKHAKADLVRVSLKGTAGKIELVIEDNGQGFDVKQARFLELSKNGFGLTSMRERTEVTGGSFSLKTIQREGTTVRASWPAKQ